MWSTGCLHIISLSETCRFENVKYSKHSVRQFIFFPIVVGSEEERKVVQFVNRFCKVKQKQNIYKKDQKGEVELDAIVPSEQFIGDDIEVGVIVKNVSDSDKNVKVHLTMSSTFYTGVVGKKVQGEKTEHLVKAGEG